MTKHLFGLLVAIVASVPLAGQAPRFSSSVSGVRVDVLVTDGNRPVGGLTAADFELRDNGVVQTISDVSREKLPVNLICVLDSSTSVRGAPLVQLKEAMNTLITALDAGDRAAFVTFSHRLAHYSKLTDDRQALRDELAAVDALGATSLVDATFAGLALREADPGRTLLLQFSDGRDTASYLSARSVLESARRTDVVIYPVSIKVGAFSGVVMMSPRGTPNVRRDIRPPSQNHNDEGERLLHAFADETGGRVFYAGDDRNLQKTFTDVLTEFRQRYVLSYSPSGVAADGWHALDVKLRGRKGQVKARRGYFATAATPAGEARTPR